MKRFMSVLILDLIQFKSCMKQNTHHLKIPPILPKYLFATVTCTQTQILQPSSLLISLFIHEIKNYTTNFNINSAPSRETCQSFRPAYLKIRRDSSLHLVFHWLLARNCRLSLVKMLYVVPGPFAKNRAPALFPVGFVTQEESCMVLIG